MVHARFRFPSRVLGRNMDLHVLFPRPQSLIADKTAEMEPDRCKCLWFFHGVSDDAAAVLLHTDIAGLCDELGVTVLLPSMENGFCLDTGADRQYRSYLTEELMPYAERVLRLSPRREDRLLGGISMGGYGACTLGLTMPERFSRIVCLSGALDIRMGARFSRACGIPLTETLRAGKPLTEEHPEWDPCVLLERLAASGTSCPELLLICSEMDIVWKSNLRLAQQGQALGLPVTLRSAPGLHDWRFWSENLRGALEWAVR